MTLFEAARTTTRRPQDSPRAEEANPHRVKYLVRFASRTNRAPCKRTHRRGLTARKRHRREISTPDHPPHPTRAKNRTQGLSHRARKKVLDTDRAQKKDLPNA